MKQYILLFAACLIASGAQASTIDLDSSAANTTNNSGQPTLNIDPYPDWAPALPNSFWISDALTGNPRERGYVVMPNGTTVTFSETFYLAGPVTSATLSVLADDTTSVVLNGVTIFAANDSPLGPHPICAAQPIGCLASTAETFGLGALAPYFRTGGNTIQFEVEQQHLVSFGLDYAGAISTAQVPEPASLALIGGGLVVLGLASRRLLPAYRATRVDPVVALRNDD